MGYYCISHTSRETANLFKSILSVHPTADQYRTLKSIYAKPPLMKFPSDSPPVAILSPVVVTSAASVPTTTSGVPPMEKLMIQLGAQKRAKTTDNVKKGRVCSTKGKKVKLKKVENQLGEDEPDVRADTSDMDIDSYNSTSTKVKKRDHSRAFAPSKNFVDQGRYGDTSLRLDDQGPHDLGFYGNGRDLPGQDNRSPPPRRLDQGPHDLGFYGNGRDLPRQGSRSPPPRRLDQGPHDLGFYGNG
eukprot:gene28814-35742_t